MRKRKEIQTVLRKKEINTSQRLKIKKKEVKQVVELDQFKYELNNFKEPLVEVRDSL